MRVAALGIDCSNPDQTWATLRGLPPVDLLVLPELAFMPWLCATRDVNPDAWERAAEPTPGATRRPTRTGGDRYSRQWALQRRLLLDGLNPGCGRFTARRSARRAGFLEATWHERGPVEFQAFDTRSADRGERLHGDVVTQHNYPTWTWSLCRGRRLRKRARSGYGGATHAVTSGAFCVLKQPRGIRRGHTMGALGWTSTRWGRPARTTDAEPVAIRDIELTEARVRPRYVARD